MKKVGLRMLLFLLGIILSLALLEIVIRVFDLPPYPVNLYPKGMYKPDEELGFILNPGWRGTFSDIEFKTTIEINSEGLRDYEHDLGSKKFKIVASGDSFAWGHGVELKETFLSYLEKRADVEVIKAGIGSYGLRQEFLMLKRMTKKYKPDLLLLAFYLGNDIGDDTILSRFHTVKDGYLVSWKNRDKPVDVRAINEMKVKTEEEWFGKSRLLRRFRVYRFFHFKLVQLGIIKNPFFSLFNEKGKCSLPIYMDFILKGFPYAYEGGRKQWKATVETFREMKGWSEEVGIPLVIVIIPDKIQVNDKLWSLLTQNCRNFQPPEKFDRLAANRALREFFFREGIRYIDLLPVFARQKKPKRLYFQKDPHLTPYGHKVAGEAIFQYLLMEGLLR